MSRHTSLKQLNGMRHGCSGCIDGCISQSFAWVEKVRDVFVVFESKDNGVDIYAGTFYGAEEVMDLVYSWT